MRRYSVLKPGKRAFIWSFLSLSLAGLAAAERLEFVEYFPGVLQVASEGASRVHADRMTIGDPEYGETTVIDNTHIFDGELFVRNEMGIGTTTPETFLHVAGSAFLAGGSGDVDGSGTLNSADSSVIGSYLNADLEDVPLTPEQRGRADVNGDGRVSRLDEMLIDREIALRGRRAVNWTVLPEASLGRLVLDRTWQPTFDSAADELRLGIGTSTPRSTLEMTGHLVFPYTDAQEGPGFIYLGDEPFVHYFAGGRSVGIQAGDRSYPPYSSTYNTGDSGYIAVGYQAISASGKNRWGTIAVGSGAFRSLESDKTASIAIGFEAMSRAPSVSRSGGGSTPPHPRISIGHRAADCIERDQADTTVFGAGALSGCLQNPGSSTQAVNVAIGKDAQRGVNRIYSPTPGMTFGLRAGFLGTHGTAFGAYALEGLSNGIAVGSHAFSGPVDENTGPVFMFGKSIGVGAFALENTISRNDNIGLGRRTLKANTDGADNIAVGSGALEIQSRGNENIAIGGGLYNLDAANGDSNIALGNQALDSLADGSNNIAMGWKAGLDPDVNPGTFSDSIFIGPSAGKGQLGSGLLVIGNLEDFPAPLIEGQMGADDFLRFNGNVGIRLAGAPAYPLDVAGGVSATATEPTPPSDIRLKQNIQPLTGVLGKLTQIQGISYSWNQLGEAAGQTADRREIGLIAQEVEAVFPELVEDWQQGSYLGIDYERFSAIFIQAAREMKTRNDQLRGRISRLKRILAQEQL